MQASEQAPEADASGKTKLIFKIPGTSRCRVESKPAITSGDGAKRAEFDRKDVYANMTTCRIFEFLAAHGVPVAYHRQTGPNSFEAEWTEMIPIEVVARRVVGDKSSYRKRNPGIRAGHRFNTLVVEFFLKTTGACFGAHTFPKDDPLITSFGPLGITTRRPDMPSWITDGNPEIVVPPRDLYGKDADVGFPYADLEHLARKVFLLLEGAWATQNLTLCDLKIECGYTSAGRVVVSDVIDPDSWRLIQADGRGLDKQGFRDGADLVTVADTYAEVAQRVARFEELNAQPDILIWCASPKDDPAPFVQEIRRLGAQVKYTIEFGSVHKQPEESLERLRRRIRRPADTVVIVYVGRSNGAGPVFACDTHVPVIAVSSTVPEHSEDIWSSVNVPSDCPLLFQKYPANAVQAALGILAARNPGAYLARRSVIESAHLSLNNSPTYGR